MPAVPDPAVPAARARRAVPWGAVGLVVALLVFAAGVLRLFELRFDVGDVYPLYSTLRSDPLGAKAFFASLDALPGRRAERSLQPLASLGTEPLCPADRDNGERGFTCFYLGADANDWPYLFDPEAAARLETIMNRGGRVVVTFQPTRTVPSVESLSAARSAHSPGGNSSPRQGPAARRVAKRAAMPDLIARWGIDFRRRSARSDTRGTDATHTLPGATPAPEPTEYASPDPALAGDPGPDGAFAAGQEAVAWHSALDFRTDTVPGALLRWSRLYARLGRPVVVSRPFGLAGGRLVLVGDSYFLSNEGLRDDPAPALLAALVGRGQRAIFDESHLGLNEEPGLATLARRYRLQGAIAALGLLVALFVWRNVVSLVPVRPAAGGEGEGAEVITGHSAGTGYLNLLRRSVRPRDLPATCLAQWESGAAPRPPGAPERLRAMLAEQAALPARRRSSAATLYRAMCAAAGKRG